MGVWLGGLYNEDCLAPPKKIDPEQFAMGLKIWDDLFCSKSRSCQGNEANSFLLQDQQRLW